MERFTTSDGVAIAYDYDASAPPGLPPVVLLHGFAMPGQLHFGSSGLVDGLADADRRTILVDARGHGESDAPTDPGQYGEARMAQDVRELTEHLDVERFDVVGYGMGAVTALLLAAEDPRVRRMAVGGVGTGIVELGGIDTREMPPHMIVQGMLAPAADAVEYPLGAAWRAFAETVDANLPALAAQAAAMHQGELALDRITAPTLVFAGDKDGLANHPERLADALPGSRLELFDADHLGAVRVARFVPAVVEWLAG